MIKLVYRLFQITVFAAIYLNCFPQAIRAQVIPDNTVNTQVEQNGNVAEITGGETRGENLFHSFQEFSVPTNNTAVFDNADAIENIFSRVTGGNISNIDGLIRANGGASLFLINPAGIIFGENASLDIGGSFIGSTADSILFPDDVEFSASDTQPEPILTVNAPIGLGFRDSPGEIVNRANSFDDGGTPDDIFDDFAIGLRLGDNNTIGLIGGNVAVEGGFVTTAGGRVEIGSVAANSTVSLTEIATGWDIGYEAVTNFQDIELTALSLVGGFSENAEVTGDVEIQGKNISLAQGSQLGVVSDVGEAGSVNIIASESVTVDGNSAEIGLSPVSSSVFNNINNQASGTDSQIYIQTPLLSLTNSGAINAFNNNSTGRGVNINIAASEISLDGTTNLETDFLFVTGIFAQTFEAGTGDGGKIDLETDRLIIKNGAQISTDTFGAGNAGNLVVNAQQFVELTGANIDTGFPSALRAVAEQTNTPTGNAGEIVINTPQLTVLDGAQINSFTRSSGNGGNINLNVSESIIFNGVAPTTDSGTLRAGIIVSAAPAIDFNSGESIPTTGNAGNLNLNTKDLTVNEGATIGANTFSRGNGGNIEINVERLTVDQGGEISAGSLLESDSIDTRRGQGGNLDITAIDSISVIGTRDINGESVISTISTRAEGTGSAGSITLTTKDLTVADRGVIDVSATGSEAAGDLRIDAQTINLARGNLRAVTNAGAGGDIILDLDENLTLRNESQISAEALNEADGGNIQIDSGFIIAFPSQPNGSDIIANAERGTGGNIEIVAESLFGIARNSATQENGSNDIDASSQFGLDGTVTIGVLDIEPVQETRELPRRLTEEEQTIAQVCQDIPVAEGNYLTLNGKGGIERQPVEPFVSETFFIGQYESESKSEFEADESLNSETIAIGQYETSQDEETKFTKSGAISTSKGTIFPARGVVVKDNGEIILTAYPTKQNISRSMHSARNCV